MNGKFFVLICAVMLTIIRYQSGNDKKKEFIPVTSKSFGKLADGREVTLYALQNRNNATVTVSTLGAALVSINVPDKKGAFGDVLLGYDNAQGYVDDISYFGAIVG